MTIRIPLCTALLAFIAAGATTQDLASPSAQPPKPAHHSLVYDEMSRRVILTGGSTPIDGGRSFTFFNDMWAFDGTRWTMLAASGDKLSGSQVVVDAGHRLVAFGGYDGRESRGDVRMFDQGAWRTTGTHPSVRAAEGGFVFDIRRRRFVQFGGSPGQGRALGETWEFDGQQWTRGPAAGPRARQAHVMVFDAKRGRTVLFGGMGSASTPGQPPPSFGDTWEYDGTTWTEKNVTGPSPRNAAGAAYDAKRGLVLIFGGDAGGNVVGDTWSWDGVAWKKLADTGPAARGMGYLAYDQARDRIVMFGGRNGWPNGDQNDTWEWDGTAWRQVKGSIGGSRSRSQSDSRSPDSP